MKSNTILLLDSGIGGLFLLDELSLAYPNYNFIYFGDNDNAPYGNLSKARLFSLALSNILSIKDFSIKTVVLACNTLSVSVRSELEHALNLPVIGVFPPVEINLLENQRVLLLSTPVTASKYSNLPNFKAIGLKNLALDIEKNVFSLNKISLLSHLSDFDISKESFDTVILGCTHYNFIKNEILDHFCPKKIVSGESFTVKFLSKILKTPKSLDKTYKNNVLFFGKNAEINSKIYFSVVKKYQN